MSSSCLLVAKTAMGSGAAATLHTNASSELDSVDLHCNVTVNNGSLAEVCLFLD